jgi:hypothetical protein
VDVRLLNMLMVDLNLNIILTIGIGDDAFSVVLANDLSAKTLDSDALTSLRHLAPVYQY